MRAFIKNKKVSVVLILLLAVMILSVTNYTKVLQGGDAITQKLYGNSQSLVFNAMLKSYLQGYHTEYGLMEMYPFNGTYEGGLTNESLGYHNGYSKTEKKIIVRDIEATRLEYVPGYKMIFINGDSATITEVESENGYLIVSYEAEEVFSQAKQGELRYISIYNTIDGRYMQTGDIVEYESQLGLQGMLFSAFPKTMLVNEAVEIGQWILSILLAVTITGISYLLYKKYNLLFSVVFFVVTMISPWIIGYATNIYWVAFTWFLPMFFGLLCATYIEKRIVRVISYLGVFISIIIKCACGYEYVSTIMMSIIVFMLTDLVVAMIRHEDKKKIVFLFKTIFFIGICAVLGFIVTLLAHAYLRGDGNIAGGLKAIYVLDVLRRTLGGDPGMFQDVYADSLNASILYVVLRYLYFKTPLILGVPGIMFTPLIAVSFCLLGIEIKRGKMDVQYIILFIWMFLASISWFVLGKSHSYIHTGMNFVMWYFGFVQIIFYILVQWLVLKVKEYKNTRGEKSV